MLEMRKAWPSDLWVPKNGSNCLCCWSLRVKCCLVHVLHRCSQKWTEEAKRLKERYKEEMAEYQKTGAISTAATKSRWVGFGSFSPTDLLPFISQRATITHNLRAILFTLALYDWYVSVDTCRYKYMYLYKRVSRATKAVWKIPYTRVNKLNSLLGAYWLLSACFFPSFAPG